MAKQIEVANGTDAAMVPYENIDETINPLKLDKNIEGMLKKVASAKPDAFEQDATDFWKPEKMGEVIQGIYLGAEQTGRFTIFGVATMSKDGPSLTRILSTRILAKELRKGETQQGVRIEYKGETKTSAGQRLKLFDVAWFKQ